MDKNNNIEIEIEKKYKLNDQVTKPMLRTQESLCLEAFCDEVSIFFEIIYFCKI